MKCSAIVLLLAVPALGAISSLDLAQYQYGGALALPAVAAEEASAVSFNPDTNSLFVLGDEGDALAEVSKTGALIGSMTLTGFEDTEGLTYIGGGQFVMTEERIQSAYRLTYSAGGSVARSGLQSVLLGATVGNVGIEGISYDPSTGNFITVKERTPQAARSHQINFAAGTAVSSDLFMPDLSVLDLSDVQTLSTVESLAGTPDADNLLIFSQESAVLLEVSRSGAVLSSFSFAGITDSAEGVTIDDDGVIYIVDENPLLHVVNPIPEPTSVAGIAAALALAARRRR